MGSSTQVWRSPLDSVSPEMQSEITSTVLVFLASTNREIVKSALGYFKVAISSLPPSAVVPHLAKLVPALLAWTHDKKNPFKTLVLRVLSQMIKRYGFEPVWEVSSGNENAAVLTYVRKRSEKARKKKLAKAKQAEEEGESDEVRPCMHFRPASPNADRSGLSLASAKGIHR